MYGRYIITVKLGRRILDRRYYDSYFRALDELNFIEERKDALYATGATVEFKDTKPFTR